MTTRNSLDDSPRGLAIDAAPHGGTLDDFVRSFERAYSLLGGADPAAYLPPAGHPLHAVVLRELVRVDLEFGWERGCPKNLSEYRRAFPALAVDREGFREIAFEEFRLRRQAGQDPSPDEYQSLYGVRIGPAADPPPRLKSASPFDDDGDDDDAPAMPEVGDEFLGFRLTGELGRGAFGRVFLARQGDMADRPVVLKVTADGFDESRTLAQLQHDNIVPVYSRHRADRLSAVCMPYLGSVTLRDVAEDLKGLGELPDSGRDLLSSMSKSSVRRGAPPTPPEPDAPRARPAADAAEGRGPAGGGDDVRAMLGRLTYVEAVVWMGARLADGLAHAHERGILHRDMKPANILLADDGRPMLLDFNLAEDLKLRGGGAGAPAGVGGTLPYMAPEHLSAYRDGGRTAVDGRSDLYALGVILFEMLTGRPPFPVRDGRRVGVIGAMLADRRGAPPRLRPWNPSVSPAVESVVRRCLASDPSRRYGSARELGEDLRLHLAHRPLRHAPDPSRRERLGKWGRRNRRWLAPASAVLVVAAVVVGFGMALASRTGQVERLEARAALARFRDRSTWAMNLIGTRAGSRDLARLREGRAAVEAALAGFHVRDDPDPAAPWWSRGLAGRLPPAEVGGLRAEAGELLLTLCRAEAAEGTDASRREAMRDNERAERSFGADPAPRGVWSQRASLYALLGDAAASAEAARRAAAVPPSSPGDFLFLADGLLDGRRPAEALPVLEEAVRLAPEGYRGWLTLGICHAQLGHPERAEACFSTCIAIWPGHPAGWINRALALQRQGKLAASLADYRRALALRPDDVEALVDSASVLVALGRPAEAIPGLDRALALGNNNPRLYQMRAVARGRMKDVEGEKRDADEVLRREPVDETGWVARAVFRSARGDHAGALADLDRVLAADPSSCDALRDKAAILSGPLHRTADAVAVLDRLLALYPHRAEIRSDRAVLLARLGRREAAVADSDSAVEAAPTPLAHWQAACVHALTAKGDPVGLALAVRHLATALRLDPRIARQVAADPDLAAIHDLPEYTRLIPPALGASPPARPDP